MGNRREKRQRVSEGKSGGRPDALEFMGPAFDKANVGICLVDLDGLLVRVNRRMCDIFGYEKAELTGMNVNEITLPDDREVSPGFIRSALRGEVTGAEFEKRYRHKSGRTVWGRVSSTLLKDAGGAPLCFLSFVNDITETKATEHALRRERDFIAAVLSTAGALVVVLDRQGRIVRFNRACEKLTGYRFAEVEGEPLWDLFLLPKEVEPVRAVFDRLRSGQFPNEHENFWVTRDGSRRRIRWSNTALTKADGAVEYVIGTGIDITETRAAEERLRASEERFSLAAAGSGYGLWDWPDTTRDAVWWSPRLFEMLGYRVDEFPSGVERFRLLIHPEDRPAVDRAITEHLEKGVPYEREIRLRTKTGAYRWFRTSGAAIRDADGRPIRMSGSLVDITDRKEAEKALKDSEGKYRNLLANLDTAVVVHAPDTGILLSNRRAQELLGLSGAELSRKKDIDPCWTFLREDGSRLPVEEYPVNRVLATMRPLRYWRVGIQRPDLPETTWTEVNAYPERDQDGRLRHVVVTFWDVTRRKRAEDRLARTNEALRFQIEERLQVEEKLRRQQRQADKDLEVAASIQKALLPSHSPRVDAVRFAWRHEPCQRIGGDILQFQRTGKHHISFYMFDVCGHGVSAALIASAVSQFLQTGSSAPAGGAALPRPDAILNDLETAFPFERFDSYFTIVYLTLDLAAGRLHYSNAGHPHPILMGADGSIRTLDAHGPVIGSDAAHTYTRQGVPLRKGDRVFVYTDGILDHPDIHGNLYGRERLVETIRQCSDGPVQAVMDCLQRSLEAFAGPTERTDDASIMVIEFTG